MSDQRPEIDPDTIADDFGLKGLTVEDGAATLTTTPTTEQAKALVLEMSLACGRMLDDDQAPNYVEFEVHKAGHPGYVVHVRRAERPTPHALRQEAEARAEKAESALARANKVLDKIAEHVCPDEDGTWTDSYGLLESIGNAIESTGRKVWDQNGDTK
ncbi:MULTISPECIES: hypothetical protein [Nocardia]|uniref:hypothetical protein n=1 Tax=Nocardia TaxID=1817 RepID=UPI002453E2B5|nr:MULTISPECIES: hypothetical protein [Nocardia]